MSEEERNVIRAAVRFYDSLDVDHLDPEYFAGGSEGQKYRGLRDSVRALREAGYSDTETSDGA